MDELSLGFALFTTAPGFARSCDASSRIGSWGGNAGCAALGSMRLCCRYGMVVISGESAHGFVRDARSCSSVGSMKLCASVRSGSGDVRGNKARTS